MNSLENFRRYALTALTAVGFNLLGPCVAFGQETTPINAGDTAWIMTSTALVLFMTIPALALFYGGLVQKRHILSVLMQCLALTAAVTLVWVVFGYSLAFDPTGMSEGTINLNSFVGGFSHLFLNGIDATAYSEEVPIPKILHCVFQLTFAIITPALIVGTFIERMKFSSMLWFSLLWLIFVYLPICHMTWGGAGGLFADWGVMDFAGGIVVHVTAGFAALVACIVIGPRLGYPKSIVPPHNMTMTVTGTAMLWVGWFGFNGGSALAANGQAAMAIAVTHISAAVATLVWMGIEWVKLGKPSVLGAATGSIAGLAAITPASGYVGPIGGLGIGLVSGFVCYYFSTTIKNTFKYDDSLDVFGVHGVGGLVGTILAGVFAASQFGGTVENLDVAAAVVTQIKAVAIAAIYTVVVTFFLLKVIDTIIGLRVTPEIETAGLDYALHDETGYNF